MKIPCMVCEYLNVYILIHNIYTIHMRYYWIRYGICVAVLAAYSSNENSRSCVFATFYHSPWPISCIQYWKERLAHAGLTAPNRASFFYFFFCFHSLLVRRCCLQVACIRASWPLAHASHTFATNMNGWLRFSLVVRRISRFSCQILACWPNGFRFSDVSPAKPCWAHLLSVGRLVGRACSGSSDCCHWAPPRWCLLYRPEEFHLCMLLHKHYSGFAVQQNAFLLCVCVRMQMQHTHWPAHSAYTLHWRWVECCLRIWQWHLYISADARYGAVVCLIYNILVCAVYCVLCVCVFVPSNHFHMAWNSFHLY